MGKKRRDVKRNKWFYFIELVSDLAIAFFSYMLGFYIHRTWLFLGDNGITFGLWQSLVLICVISLFVFVVSKTYKCGQISYMDTMINLVFSIFAIALLSVFADYLIKGVGIFRGVVFYAVIAQIVLSFVSKYIFIIIHNRVVKPKSCTILAESLEVAAEMSLDFIESKNINIKYLLDQNFDNIESYLDRTEKVYMSDLLDYGVKKTVMEYCALNDIDFASVPSFEDLVINSGIFDNAGDVLLISTNIKHDVESRIAKRSIDLFVSILMIILLSPLMLLAVILIKIQDGGKVLYSQKRLTKGNTVFSIYKFRSMIENAEKKTGAVLAKADDERITKIGKFLRNTRIDELPQLFNILKGDMSLVGPRPERPDLVEQIVKETPEFQLRTIVKAGLTGIAQTKGKYTTGFKNKLLFDLYYVNNFSLLLDLKIMYNTIKVVLSPTQAEGLQEIGDIKRSKLSILKEKGYGLEKVTESCIKVIK